MQQGVINVSVVQAGNDQVELNKLGLFQEPVGIQILQFEPGSASMPTPNLKVQRLTMADGLPGDNSRNSPTILRASTKSVSELTSARQHHQLELGLPSLPSRPSLLASGAQVEALSWAYVAISLD